MSREDFSMVEVIIRCPLMTFWLWLNLLLFNVANQRKPEAILEDAKNKPWRPLPAGRLQPKYAEWLLVVLYPADTIISHYLGALNPCIALQTLAFIYNDLGAGENWKLRNVINAGGFISFHLGAVLVVQGSRELENGRELAIWMLLLATVIASTMHIQDLYDQEGDKLRGRWTIPLVFGESKTRMSIGFAVLFWSFLVPAFLRLQMIRYLPSVVLGSIIIGRLLGSTERNMTNDKATYKIWSSWIVSLYCLPLSSQLFLTSSLK
ncbi:MAG: hypothetical protein Q9219_005871 [cf. Caloplaca sp. 3 TL-2023]